ncbi:MAG: hypothetical protein ACPGSB_07605 [Opitutales bacterium]
MDIVIEAGFLTRLSSGELMLFSEKERENAAGRDTGKDKFRKYQVFAKTE